MTPVDLRGLRVLLTRPHPHNDSLQAALEACGAEVRTLPLLAIELMPDTPALRQRIMNLDLYQMVMVVSPNAARLGLEWIDRFWPQLPTGIDWIAVGRATAAVLEAEGIRVQVPSDGHDSEALLRLPRLQQVAGDKVLILRGEGGRELLSSTLRERGAQVDYAELYRRVAPTHSKDELDKAFNEFDPQILVLFSGESCQHLLALAREHDIPLRQRQLWLPSERAVADARAQGLDQLAVLAALDEPAIVQALGEWHHRAKP